VKHRTDLQTDLTGQTFNLLTAVRYIGSKNGKGRWICTCACDSGKIVEVSTGNLRSGSVKSCGCLKRQPKTHGRSNTPEYQAWHRMLQRCTNLKHPDYAAYGGRGIKVCRRWRKSFVAFFKDAGLRPSAAHEIDRWPNNNGGYCPGNVRWATRKQQTNNTRTNHFLSHDGERLSIAEWTARLGLQPTLLSSRLNRGWSVKRALTTPPRRGRWRQK